MATIYVYSGATGAANGTSWTDAYTTFVAAVAAGYSAGDLFLIHYAHAEGTAGGTRTYTFTADCSVISVNKDSSNALTAMGTSGYIGTSSGYAVNLAPGNCTIYLHGITILIGDTGTARTLGMLGDGGSLILEDCRLRHGGGAGNVAIGGQDQQTYVRWLNTELSFYSTGGNFTLSGDFEWSGGAIASDSAAITSFISGGNTDPGGASARITGVDLSAMSSTATLLGTSTTNKQVVSLSHCKIPSSAVPLGTLTANTQAYPELWMYDCASGDQHYHIAHYNSQGNTVVSTITYCNDNICDTNLSWVISSASHVDTYHPYVSPWLEVYNADVSTSVTPSIEGLQCSETDSNYSTTAQNDEVWSQWGYKNTSGSVQMSIRNGDRPAPLASPSDQTSSKTTSDWTISATEDAYKSTFKLSPASAFTPSEVGMVMARVCLGKPSWTVHICPQIRGLA